MNLLLVYITNPTKKEAKRVAKHLLKNKLISCANIFPITSLYRWEGRLADEKEFVLIAKTLTSKFAKVKSAVRKIHPYKVPCIVKIPATSNKAFFNWVKNEVTK